MGVFIGLLFALGAFLIWHAVTSRATVEQPSIGRRWAMGRRAMLRQAGVQQLSHTRLLAVQAAVALVAGLAVLALTDSISVGVCFAFFAWLGPPAVVRGMRDRRLRELRDVWPEVVDNLSSAVRAGLSLPEAVAALADRGPEQLRPAFAAFAADYRVTGRFAESLDALKNELADPIGDRVCESLRLAREVGGTDLGRLLRTLSAFLREDSRTRAELETRQGWTVNAARLAVAAPWVVLLILSTQSTTLDAYDSTSGRLLLVSGAVVCFVAYRLMLRIGQLPERKRVLS